MCCLCVWVRAYWCLNGVCADHINLQAIVEYSKNERRRGVVERKTRLTVHRAHFGSSDLCIWMNCAYVLDTLKARTSTDDSDSDNNNSRTNEWTSERTLWRMDVPRISYTICIQTIHIRWTRTHTQPLIRSEIVDDAGACTCQRPVLHTHCVCVHTLRICLKSFMSTALNFSRKKWMLRAYACMLDVLVPCSFVCVSELECALAHVRCTL